MCLKIAHSRLQLHLLGANELTHCSSRNHLCCCWCMTPWCLVPPSQTAATWRCQSRRCVLPRRDIPGKDSHCRGSSTPLLLRRHSSRKHPPKYKGPLLLTWICNYIHHKAWDEITYPFPNFLKVWEWISDFIPHFTYPCWDPQSINQ